MKNETESECQIFLSGETPGTVETTTTESTVDLQREQQQIELRQIQQRQEELARLQEQQAQLQQQLEAATSSLSAQEISTQVGLISILFGCVFHDVKR